MKLHHRIENNVYILSVDGEFVAQHIIEMEQKIMPMTQDEQIIGIIINFEKVTFIDSSGIGLILAVYKILEERSAKLGICHLNEDNVELFQMTRLSDILSIYSTEKEALSHY